MRSELSAGWYRKLRAIGLGESCAPRLERRDLEMLCCECCCPIRVLAENAVDKQLMLSQRALMEVLGVRVDGEAEVDRCDKFLVQLQQELKRLGLVSQPWMVVPNHIIEQVGREAKQWYPAANVLVGTTGTDAEGWRRLVAQTATSDWDLVLVPKSVFTGITVSPERQAAHLEAATDAMRAAADSGSDTSFKRMQQAIKDQETRITKLTEAGRKDTGLNFEESGCDYLLVDFTSRTTGRTGGGHPRCGSWRAPPVRSRPRTW